MIQKGVRYKYSIRRMINSLPTWKDSQMTFYATADEMRKHMDFLDEHNGAHVNYNLANGLEEIKKQAIQGHRVCIFQQYGQDVDFAGLKKAFESLGFGAEDISGKPTKPNSGYVWPNRSLKITW